MYLNSDLLRLWKHLMQQGIDVEIYAFMYIDLSLYGYAFRYIDFSLDD